MCYERVPPLGKGMAASWRFKSGRRLPGWSARVARLHEVLKTARRAPYATAIEGGVVSACGTSTFWMTFCRLPRAGRRPNSTKPLANHASHESTKASLPQRRLLFFAHRQPDRLGCRVAVLATCLRLRLTL